MTYGSGGLLNREVGTGMGTKWFATKFPGVRFRKHPSRKHGVRPDRYFTVRYQAKGQRREEGLGWASEGWSETKAAIELAKLKEGFRTGEGPARLAEKRRRADEQREAEAEEFERRQRQEVTFDDFWVKQYFPQAKQDKSKRSWKRESQLFRLWIEPVIGEIPLKDISPLHLERVKANMKKAGRAPRSVQYCLAIIRQVFNRAHLVGIYRGDNPATKVRQPTIDNRRLRFLTVEEANSLIQALQERSSDLHAFALLSLHCGLRAGEIFSLTWSDVDLKGERLTLKNTKSGKSRVVHMAEEVKAILKAKTQGAPQDLVFPSRTGGKRNQVSKTFNRVVKELGLNIGLTDPRQRVCFHTLRHTFASWLVENGTDLYTVKELMGHGTLTMTERYAHLGESTMVKAIRSLEGTIGN